MTENEYLKRKLELMRGYSRLLKEKHEEVMAVETKYEKRLQDMQKEMEQLDNESYEEETD